MVLPLNLSRVRSIKWHLMLILITHGGGEMERMADAT